MFKTWTLTSDSNRYTATKNDKYFIFKNSKYYIYTNDLKPIRGKFAGTNNGLQGAFEAVFTDKGKQRNPFLFAAKEVN